MTNVIHADEKQSREGLLFGLDRGRAACPLDCLRKRGSGFYWFRGFSGGGATLTYFMRRSATLNLST